MFMSLLCSFFILFADNKSIDQQLIDQAVKQKAATQPVLKPAKRSEIKSRVKPFPRSAQENKSEFDDLPEVSQFRKDQIIVKEGVVSYPKDWPIRMATRKTDGITHEGKSIITEDGESKKIVIYNVDELLCDIPDFEAPNTSNTEIDFEKERDNNNFDQPRKMTPSELKRFKKMRQAKQLEELIQTMLDDRKNSKVVIEP